ncbi:MAG: chemotaxis protein CheA [Planctomycetota bacterium]|nr:chemotaxis protein CheA [Planctomycetota bacterium]RLS26566.1 MAG: chemotaxis protein CheA [Planctomycetota bacterium]
MDDRFLDMFFEEARELLMVLEEGLMEMESRQEDRAFLDKVFRSAHSIKGAAGMVGLSNVAGLTDKIETVLDKIRSKQVPIDSDIISTLLEARDLLSVQVDSAANGEITEAPEALIARLEQFTKPPSQRVQMVENTSSGAGPAKPTEAVGKVSASVTSSPETMATEPPTTTKKPKRKRREKSRPTDSSAASLPAEPVSSNQSGGEAPPEIFIPAEPAAALPIGYRIRFAPGRDILKRGMNPLGVLDELAELGEAILRVDPSHIPTLDTIDPQLNYLAWEIELRTKEPMDRIQDVFLFVGEDCRFEINPFFANSTSEYDSQSVLNAPQIIEPESGTSLLPGLAIFENLVKSGPIPNDSQANSAETETRTTSSINASLEQSRSVRAAGSGVTDNTGLLPGGLLPASADALSKVVRSASSRAAWTGASGAVNKNTATPRIRVDAAQLDDLVGLAGELAVLADNLQGIREISGAESYRLALESLERVTRQVRDQSLELRMVPVEELFSRFPRLIRDLADKSGKEIQLRMDGQETRLDRTIVERLAEPMIHLIRNSVDHGLESPEEREAAGKPRQGRIVLWAGHEGDRVALKIEDDGCGLNRQRIVEKGIAKGLVPPNTSADDPRVVSLIFEPGFSTRDSVSELSGRGVGLDVVRDAVRALRGSVSVQSEPGRGTCFTFRLPLTLALIDGLLVEVAHEKYVVPLSQVEECVALGGTRPALSSGRMCVSVRDELVPLVNLRKLFEAKSPNPRRQEILLTRHGGQRVGVSVDKLLGRVQAVIQSLGEGLGHLGRFSGATILGDGAVSLILDLTAIVAESRAAEIRADLARALSKPEVIS